jgi:AraC family transcriptional regulator
MLICTLMNETRPDTALMTLPEHHGYDLISESARQIPGAVQFTIKRYVKPDTWTNDDVGIMNYQFAENKSGNSLQIYFCIQGNTYCNRNGDCESCPIHAGTACPEKLETIDALSFTFTPGFLSQFQLLKAEETTASESILSFSHKTSFTKTVSLCPKTRTVLEGLLNHNYTGSLENIYVNAQVQMLLLYSLNCMIGEKAPEYFECKFLANEADREKIMKAREVLINHIGEPITIKELSRKVAINECYLKKGFKELFGTTIFDFYQGQRMEHARYLLYEKGLSVTEVSFLLGYSSISHFSTAFKKHTGIKPCELLLRA